MAKIFLGRALAAFALSALAFPIAAGADDISQSQKNWETQFGQQRYMQMMQRGEIVPPQSPLYATLKPIADKIGAVVNSLYFTPFHFILVNQGSPNALSVPGGNVYVTTSMLSFVKNQDELAGVLCHEVNHDIHHDVYNLYQQGQHENAQAAAFTREAESKADRDGAYTCAKAGFNPWGMVWNFRQYRNDAGTGHQAGALSDHPSDDQRVADLIALFNSDRATFGKFRDDVAASIPIKLPTNMQVAQQSPQGYGYPSQGPPPGYGYPSQGPPPGYGYPSQGPPPGYGYPSQGPPPGYGYPSQGPPPGYGYPSQGPPPGYGYPSQGPPPGYGYPSQGPPPGYGYPSQGPPPGYGYPSQYPPPGYGYPSQYPPPGYGYPPQGPPPGYGYPPQGPPPG